MRIDPSLMVSPILESGNKDSAGFTVLIQLIQGKLSL